MTFTPRVREFDICVSREEWTQAQPDIARAIEGATVEELRRIAQAAQQAKRAQERGMLAWFGMGSE